MKFVLKVLVIIAFILTIASSYSLKSNYLNSVTKNPTETNTKATTTSETTSPKAVNLIASFKDPSLKNNPERDNILNSAFLKYVFQVIGYSNDDGFNKCLEAIPSQNKVNAISAFKKIWANRDEANNQVNYILENIKCTHIADLKTKITAAGVLDKLITEIKQFIKTLRLFLRMFR